MIGVLLVLTLVGMAMPQRSPYLAPSSQSYPGLLPRFKENSSSTVQPAGGSLGDRLGGGEAAAPEWPAGSSFVDGTLYDKDTIDRVSQWPKEKQPFWYVNRLHIASHRGGVQQGPSNATN